MCGEAWCVEKNYLIKKNNTAIDCVSEDDVLKNNNRLDDYDGMVLIFFINTYKAGSIVCGVKQC